MIFWSQNGFRLDFWWFFMSLWFVSCKTPKYLIVTQFQEILSKNMPIFAENGSRSLKSQYLEITNSNGMSKNCPGNLKFGQVGVQSSLKLLYGSYFQFCLFGHFSMLTLGMITFSWLNYSNYHVLLKCIYLINLQKYPPFILTLCLLIFQKFSHPLLLRPSVYLEPKSTKPYS